MSDTRTNRYLMAGALAGASSVVVAALAATCLLGIGVLWQYAFSSSIPVIGDTALGAVSGDVGRIPSFLWGWRWALLGAAVVGVPLAYGDRRVQRWPYAWRGRVIGAALLGVVTAVVCTALLATADSTLYALDALPGDLPTLSERQPQVWNLLLVAAVAALALAGALWLSWSWWYQRWQSWLGARQAAASPADGPAATSSTEDWLSARQAQRTVQRRVAALGAVGLALAAAGVIAFSAVRAEVRSGDVWARPDAPNVAVRLTLDRRARELMVENTFGNGEVSVALLRESDQQAVSPAVTLSFDARGLGGKRQAIDVAGLPAGRYLLNAQLRSGEGGRAGYALLQSYAGLAAPAAVLVGLGLGLALACAALLVGMAAQRQGIE